MKLLGLEHAGDVEQKARLKAFLKATPPLS
jgi:hypothetical protein